MKKIVHKFLRIAGFTNTKRKNTPTKDEVINATNKTLNQYSKTFKDLALYDRGAKI